MKKNQLKLLVYTIFISLISTSILAKDCFKCAGTYFPIGVATLVRNLYNLVKVLVPVIVIITGMVELIKSVMASDEKKMDESKTKLIKKIIAGVVIFLLFAIVQFVFKNLLANNDALSNSMLDCVKYFISEEPSSTACPSRPGGNSANGGSSSGGSNGGSSSNGTSNGGTSTKNCGEYTTSSECPTDRCSWGYHNSSEMHCANKKSCGEYTTSSECPTDRCSWGYHNSSQMHCANKESSSSNTKSCGEYTTSSECPTDRCSWGYHNSSQMHCANKESSNSNKKDCESECNSKYTQGTTAHFHCLDAC